MKLEFLLLFYYYVNSAERQSYTGKGNRKKESEVAQLCLTLSDPVDCSPPSSSIHGIFQVRVLQWGTISFSRGPSPHRDQTLISHIVLLLLLSRFSRVQLCATP